MPTLVKSDRSTGTIAEIEEAPDAQKNRENRHKPNVVIFDPLVAFHWPLLESCFGDLLNLLNVLKFDVRSFSRVGIDRGSIGPGLTMDDIIGLNPILVISELVLAPFMAYDCHFGIKMLTNLFSNEQLDNTGLILVSSFLKRRISEALDETSLKFRVKKTFDWNTLRSSEDQRSTLHDLIFEAYAGNIPDRPDMNGS
jgi:hypothetical protein